MGLGCDDGRESFIAAALGGQAETVAIASHVVNSWNCALAGAECHAASGLDAQRLRRAGLTYQRIKVAVRPGAMLVGGFADLVVQEDHRFVYQIVVQTAYTLED